MNKYTLLLAVVLYVVSAAASFLVFSQAQPPRVSLNPNEVSTTGDPADDGLPKTQACPLNGSLYSTRKEALWQSRRPLGVMIENHEESRPQSGLSRADVVYEAVAEGGITRFLAMYYCQDAPMVGPVRSARVYFMDMVGQYGDYPLYAHVGGANTPGPADALGQIERMGWAGYNDLNQFSIPFPTFWRDYDRLGRTVATEHTMYSTTEKLWNYAAEKRKLTNVDEDGKAWDEDFSQYTFKDGKSGTTAQSYLMKFWDDRANYDVVWNYDPATNTYKRNNGGMPHMDLNTDTQLAPTTVVGLWMKESSANDGYENNAHRLYQTSGTGKATILMEGKTIEGTWKKANRAGRLEVFDQSGKPLVFARGQIWFAILPLDGTLRAQ
jgi:hypothetical protein